MFGIYEGGYYIFIVGGRKKKINVKGIFSFIFVVFDVIIPIVFGIYALTPEFKNNSFLFEEQKISNLCMGCFIVFIMLVISRTGIYVCIKLEKFKETIKNKDKEIDGLKNELSKFVDSNIQNNDSIKIIECMKKMCFNNNDIIGIQLYQCSETKISKKKICYKFIPTEYRYTSNGQSLNSIYETYNIKIDSINKYTKTREKYLRGNKQILNNYIKELTNRLRTKEANVITDTIINDYCFLVLATQLLFGDVQIEIKSLNKTFQERINNSKRTGFLRGMIEQNYYVFMHKESGIKYNRVYLTNVFDVRDIPHMFVITFRPDILQKIGYSDYIEETGIKFYNVLKDELKIVYNNYADKKVGADNNA